MTPLTPITGYSSSEREKSLGAKRFSNLGAGKVLLVLLWTELLASYQ